MGYRTTGAMEGTTGCSVVRKLFSQEGMSMKGEGASLVKTCEDRGNSNCKVPEAEIGNVSPEQTQLWVRAKGGVWGGRALGPAAHGGSSKAFGF